MSLVALWRDFHYPASEIMQQAPAQTDSMEQHLDADSQISKSIGTALARFGGCVPKIVMENMRWLSRYDTSGSPSISQELEASIDHIFRSSTDEVKKAIIDEVNGSLGISSDNLKDCLERARLKLA